MADSHICNTYSINVIPSFHNKTKDTDKGIVIDKTEMQKPTLINLVSSDQKICRKHDVNFKVITALFLVWCTRVNLVQRIGLPDTWNALYLKTQST